MGSVRSNLAMGNPEATEEQLWHALEQVNLAEFVKSLGGLDAPVAEKGSNLSGGQRQRLALARALLQGRARAVLQCLWITHGKVRANASHKEMCLMTNIRNVLKQILVRNV